jgi:hypothetical protein
LFVIDFADPSQSKPTTLPSKMQSNKQPNSGWIAPNSPNDAYSLPHDWNQSKAQPQPRSSFSRGAMVLVALFLLALVSAALCAVFASNHLMGDPSNPQASGGLLGSTADQTSTKLVSIGRGLVQQLAKELPKSNSTFLKQTAQVFRANGTLDIGRLESMAEKLFGQVNRSLTRIEGGKHINSTTPTTFVANHTLVASFNSSSLSVTTESTV